MVDSLLWMGGIAVAALIGSVVGLWFFWNPARYIFVLAYLLVMGLSGCPLGGLREQNSQWYDWYLNAIEVVIVVLLTASMWTKPLRKLFQKSSVSSKAT